MHTTSRRDVIRAGLASIALPGVTASSLGADNESAIKIHYLEIVTPDVAGACAIYSQAHGVTFGEPVPKLGGARTAKLASGGMLGIRAPMRDTEKPVVRPYVLVKDIKAAVAAAAKAGAETAMAPTEIAGLGQFAVVVHGGIDSGLWQL